MQSHVLKAVYLTGTERSKYACMKEKCSLKDTLFNATKVHKIASEIKAVYE